MQEEKQRLINSLLYPVLFLVIIWLVKVLEIAINTDLHFLGIYPKTLGGLKGIFFSPFIHGDFSHLIANTMPLLVLGGALFYFYRVVAIRVVIFSVLITGLWVWVVARPSFHIGASGVIYSLAAFLFTSGIIRKHPRLMAISLLVVFIYGGMVWGILPIKERVSWESHLMGMACGIMLAFYFKKHGPQRKLYSWELEELEEELPDAEDLSDKDTIDAIADTNYTKDKQSQAKDQPGFTSHTGKVDVNINYTKQQE